MLIHRIAHPLVVCPDAGRTVGPYNAGSTATRLGMDSEFTHALREVAEFLLNRLDSSHTPPPFMEGVGIQAGREQSVFLSEAQASEWFADGVEQMREAGFLWFTYEIQERYVRAARLQAVALLKRARLVTISEIPFSSQPDYCYCTYCGYNVGCACWDACEGCDRIAADCWCYLNDEDDDLVCQGCYEQRWSCMC